MIKTVIFSFFVIILTHGQARSEVALPQDVLNNLYSLACDAIIFDAKARISNEKIDKSTDINDIHERTNDIHERISKELKKEYSMRISPLPYGSAYSYCQRLTDRVITTELIKKVAESMRTGTYTSDQ